MVAKLGIDRLALFLEGSGQVITMDSLLVEQGSRCDRLTIVSKSQLRQLKVSA